jgi:uncharacterized repeat protein (TIGR03803 family)
MFSQLRHRIDRLLRPVAAWGLTVLAAGTSLSPGAASYEVLAEFSKPGTQVVAPMTAHSDENFYGVAAANGAFDQGTVFKLTPAGVLSTLHAFSGTEGTAPAARLAEGADLALYGTAPQGGANGFGSVFKITTAGVFAKLVDFTGASGAAPGSVPHALVLHTDGNFYGVCQAGGTNGFGIVFKMTPAGAVTTLVNFSGTAGTRPGAQPMGPLVFSGNLLYGVTKTGGAANAGVIFEVSTTGTWRSLGEFTGTTGTRPGANPAGGLLLNTDGALYGSTEFGGTNGFGVAFKTTTAASPVFTTLRHFADATGSQPCGTLVRGSDGLLYGATANGGTNGLGAVFKISTTGTYTAIANLTGESGAAAGSALRGGLTLSGTQFHAVTSSGGPGNLGTAFKLTSTGTYTSLAALSPTNGWMPGGAPAVADSNSLLFPMSAGGTAGGGNVMKITTSGALSVEAALGGTLGSAADGGLFPHGADWYGVAAKGGSSARGTMFRFTPGSGAALVSTFVTSGGSLSEGPLVQGLDGLFYGVSREGGASTRGTTYKITTAGTRTRLVSFTGTNGAAPGAKPRGPLVLSGNGNFYGLAEEGGSNNTGVIFRLTSGGVYSVISSFGATGPRAPQGGFASALDGFLYATTSLGGAADAGCLIRFDPAQNTWETAAEFTGAAGAAPGALPGGELHVDARGVIHGTTLLGGAADEGCVFRFSETGGLRTLIEFSGLGGTHPGSAGGSDGAGLILSGGIVTGPDGKLYGTAPSGGANGGGVAYRVVPPPLIEDWKLARLGDAQAADLDDPDHDGVPTLLEYALLGDPAIPDANLIPTAGIDGGQLTITLPRDPQRADITVVVEVSGDLLTWSPLATSANGAPFSGPGYDSGDDSLPGLKSVLIRDTLAPLEPSRRFVRIKVLR